LIFKTKIIKHWPFFIVLAVSILAHHVWLNPSSTLTFADWSYWPPDATKELWNSWGAWLSNESLGEVNIQVSFYIFNIVWSLFAHLGFSYFAAVKFTFMIPIIFFGVFSPYYLSIKLFDNRAIAFILAIFYSSGSYFLILQTSHLPIAFVYSIAPLILALLINAIKSNKLVNWISFALVYWICSCYEIRITSIVTGIIILYVIFNHIELLNKLKRNILVSLITILGLSSFWLLPTLLGGASGSIEATAGQGLFGSNLFSLARAFVATDSSWTGGLPNQNFVPQPIKLYFFIFPIIALLALLNITKWNSSHKRKILFFVTLMIIGVFLTKQTNQPISAAYRFLYLNVPVFNLFREASKYYLITSMAYVGLIGYALYFFWKRNETGLKKYKHSFYVASSALIIVGIVNLLPLIFNNFGTLFQSRTEPYDYKILNQFISSQPDYFRTYWYPSSSRWGDFSNLHPKISASDVTSGTFDALNVSEHSQIASEKINDFAESPQMQSLADDMSIKYFIVPGWDTKNSDDVFDYYGDDRQTYINTLNQLPWLKRINIGTKQVIVYQNLTYDKYVSAINSITRLGSSNEVITNYNILKSLLNKNADYTFEGDQNIASHQNNTNSAIDIFGQLTASNFSKNNIHINFHVLAHTNALIYLKNPYTAHYTIDNDNVSFYEIDDGHELIDGGLIKSTPNKISLGTAQLNESLQSYIANGQSLQNLSTKNGTYNYPTQANVKLYTSDGPDLINNPSFNDGLWSNKVQDCNDFDNNPEISMLRVIPTNVGGKYALELGSGNHTACTSKSNIAVKPGNNYILKFDYQTTVARHAGYSIVFNDSKHTSKTYDLPVNDRSWHYLKVLIKVPDDVTSLDLKVYGYPDDQHQQYATTRYDNFDLSSLGTIFSKNILTNNFTSVHLNSGLNKFVYRDNSYSFKNLIINPSFENGSWQKKVGDCNDYDKYPSLGMRVVSNQHTSGGHSLELSAKRHIACTSPASIDVQPNQTYNYSFDYKALNGSIAGYTISFNDANHTTESKEITWTDNNWHSVSTEVTAPTGASKMNITIYSYANQYANKNMIVYYDDFYMTNLPNVSASAYVFDNLAKKNTAPDNLTFNSVDPTSKSIKILKVKGTFYLKMSEAYSSNWRLRSGMNIVPQKDHYDINGFENSWYVDPVSLCKNNSDCTRNSDGTYNLLLTAYYGPQKYFYIGIVISGITLSVSLLYLIYSGLSKRLGKTH
jgi:hypothetical protein